MIEFFVQKHKNRVGCIFALHLLSQIINYHVCYHHHLDELF